MSRFTSSKADLLLPVVFFGYAIWANTSMYLAPKAAKQAEDFSVSSMLDGDTATEMNTLYKTSLPHRDFAVGAVGAVRYALLDSGRTGVVVGRDGWLFTEEEFRKPAESTVTDAVARIVAMRDQLQAKGISVILVPIPTKAEIYGEHLGGFLSATGMSQTYDDFTRRLTDAAVMTVDARAALRQAKSKGDVFLRSDTHWTPAGAEAVADAIATTAKDSGLALTQATVAGDAQPAVQVWGDLTKFITTPEFATTAGLLQEHVPLFRAKVEEGEQQATDLFGTASTVPVALVGTSYSANENWSFVDFLRMKLSADVLNVAKEGLGPGVPMVEFMDSPMLSETPPQVVVWEFPVRYLASDTLWQRAAAAGQTAQAPKQEIDPHA